MSASTLIPKRLILLLNRMRQIQADRQTTPRDSAGPEHPCAGAVHQQTRDVSAASEEVLSTERLLVRKWTLTQMTGCPLNQLLKLDSCSSRDSSRGGKGQRKSKEFSYSGSRVKNMFRTHPAKRSQPVMCCSGGCDSTAQVG